MDKKNLPADVKIDNETIKKMYFDIIKEEKRKEKYQYTIKRRRIRLIEHKIDAGAKCSICGYAKNFAALMFHYPEKKSFGLNSSMADMPKDKFREEMKNAILICHNCHLELHHPQLEMKKLQK